MGTMPRSTTSQPTDWRPATALLENMAPDVLESLPTRTLFPAPESSRNEPNPAATAAKNSGVRGSPTRPLKPETLTINPGGNTMDISDLMKGNEIGVVQPRPLKVIPDCSTGATDFARRARVFPPG